MYSPLCIYKEESLSVCSWCIWTPCIQIQPNFAWYDRSSRVRLKRRYWDVFWKPNKISLDFSKNFRDFPDFWTTLFPFLPLYSVLESRSTFWSKTFTSRTLSWSNIERRFLWLFVFYALVPVTASGAKSCMVYPFVQENIKMGSARLSEAGKGFSPIFT